MEQHKSGWPTDERIARAMTYTLSRWRALTQSLSEGALEMDNNAIERSIRQVAAGRKNGLYAGRGAQSAFVVHVDFAAGRGFRTVLVRQVASRTRTESAVDVLFH
jgi:hypothetical protein